MANVSLLSESVSLVWGVHWDEIRRTTKKPGEGCEHQFSKSKACIYSRWLQSLWGQRHSQSLPPYYHRKSQVTNTLVFLDNTVHCHILVPYWYPSSASKWFLMVHRCIKRSRHKGSGLDLLDFLHHTSLLLGHSTIDSRNQTKATGTHLFFFFFLWASSLYF